MPPRFALLGRATWWLGGLLGAAARRRRADRAPPAARRRPPAHGVAPGRARQSTAVLEPPGLLALNYGVQTPAVAVAAHLVYGIALGLLLQAR